MDFNSITIKEVVIFITAMCVIAGFCFKIFSFFQQVNTNTENIKKLEEGLRVVRASQNDGKNELINKVNKTNEAVNLICCAVSALIEDALLDNQDSKNQLIEIKRKLDSSKEII